MSASKTISYIRSLPGFTLLELMISTVLGSILLLTATALFMTFMIGNANTNARRQMSAEGIQMLGTLEYHIRNAKSAGVGVSSPGACAGGVGTTGKYLTLSNVNSSKLSACFTPVVSPTHLRFDRASATCDASDPSLNSDSVIMPAIPGSSVQFTCVQAANGKQTVKIDFNLGPSEDSTIKVPFSTIVQLRNS